MADAGDTGDTASAGTRAGHRRRGRTTTLRLGLVAVVTAASGAACGDGSSDEQGRSGGDVATDTVEFEATTGFLRAATERSTGEPFRVELSMGMRVEAAGDDLDAEATIMRGEQDGAAYEWQMDMSDWLDEIPRVGQGTGGVDMRVDMAGDTEVLYMRAPMYAQLADQMPDGSLGPVGELAALGDGWGRVDLQALGDLSLTKVQTSAGAPSGADPRVMLEVVTGADSVEELGSDSVDGEEVQGLGADVALGEMLEAQGVQVEEFVQQMGSNIGGLQGRDPSTAADMAQAVVDAEVPFEVWVDGAGYVRRVGLEMDLLQIFTPLADQFADQGIQDFVMSQTVDYSDYGDEGIEIELPPPGAEDATDITEAYRRMLEAGQSAQPTAGG